MNPYVNSVAARDVYPTYPGGDSTSIQATTPFPSSWGGYPDGNTAPESDGGAVNRAIAIGSAGKPATWWVSLAVLLVVLMYTARKFDGDGSYANLKLSAYNIFIVTLSAIIGMSLFKVAATKFPVPGLSAVILAS